MIIHGDFGLLWEKIMKRGLFLLLAMFSINPIFSFGRIPSMRMIKKDIEANYQEYINTDIFYQIDSGDIRDGSIVEKRDLTITSIKEIKSEKEEDSYSTWCDITFEDEYYRDSCTIVVSYDRDRKKRWKMKNIYEEADTRKSEVLKAPSEKNIKNLIATMHEPGTNDYFYIPGKIIKKIMRSESDGNVCEVEMNITNFRPFMDYPDGVELLDIVEDINPTIDLDAGFYLVYDNVNTWEISLISAKRPDIQEFVKEPKISESLIEIARFYLKGDRNLDSLYVDPKKCWTEGNTYYVVVSGKGGEVTFKMGFVQIYLSFACVSMDTSGWNYQ